jgi:hypothetical protein
VRVHGANNRSRLALEGRLPQFTELPRGRALGNPRSPGPLGIDRAAEVLARFGAGAPPAMVPPLRGRYAPFGSCNGRSTNLRLEATMSTRPVGVGAVVAWATTTP